MKPIVPCLWFDNCALGAVRYYVSIFPESVIGRIVLKNPAQGMTDENVLTVEFILNGREFMGLNGGNFFAFNEAVSFTVPCGDQEELDHYWRALSEGGEEVQCGWLKDRYGLSWQVVPENMAELLHSDDPVRAERKMKAMLGMKKIVISELESA